MWQILSRNLPIPFPWWSWLAIPLILVYLYNFFIIMINDLQKLRNLMPNEAMVCLVQLWLRTKVISENSHLEFGPLLWLKQWKTISQFCCFLSWVNILSPLELDDICSFCDSSILTALVYTFFSLYFLNVMSFLLADSPSKCPCGYEESYPVFCGT